MEFENANSVKYLYLVIWTLNIYVLRPLLNPSSPIKASNYLRVAAPLAYVIPSKIESAASVFGTSPAMGWVVII